MIKQWLGELRRRAQQIEPMNAKAQNTRYASLSWRSWRLFYHGPFGGAGDRIAGAVKGKAEKSRLLTEMAARVGWKLQSR